MSNINLRHNNELLVYVQDNKRMPKLYGAANFIGGSNLALNEAAVPNIINGSDNNTIPHELGHTLGLHHVDDFGTIFSSPKESWGRAMRDSNKTNIMFSGDGGYNVDKTSITVIPMQINLIIERYKNGNINLR